MFNCFPKTANPKDMPERESFEWKTQTPLLLPRSDEFQAQLLFNRKETATDSRITEPAEYVGEIDEHAGN